MMLQDEIAAIGIETVIIAGDFNSVPESATFRHMVGQMPDYKTNMERGYSILNEQEVTAIARQSKLAFRSAYETYYNDRHPVFTIHCGYFSGCLDYIFHSNDLTPVKLLNLPEYRDVADYTPNAEFPSDHYPIASYFSLS